VRSAHTGMTSETFCCWLWSNVCVRVDPQKSRSMEQPTNHLVVIQSAPATAAAAVIINDLILGLRPKEREREKPSERGARKSMRDFITRADSYMHVLKIKFKL
jgi:hypothetical protein